MIQQKLNQKTEKSEQSEQQQKRFSRKQKSVKGLWRNGNASDYGSEDSRFDPWQARIFLLFFLSFFFLKS